MKDLFEEYKFDRKARLRVSELGAFASDAVVEFYLRRTPRPEEASRKRIPAVLSADLLIHEDAWNSGHTSFHRIPLERVDPAETDVPEDPRSGAVLFARPGSELWRLTFDFKKLLPRETEDGEGLFYYHYAVHTDDGVTLILGGERPTELGRLENFVGERQLLLTQPDYLTSSFFREGPVYHIFVDRFRRSGKSPVKKGVTLDPDWEGGIPQYGEYPGAEVANDVFFGGDLWGIAEKLAYIRSLGVKTVYLSPVFEAYSNHKYDTGDYLRVDEMFGGDAALTNLCREAEKAGIAVMLDGVFNHTGSDSRYFNKEGRYPDPGAYQSEKSPWFHWYTFEQFPDKYECWWGVKTLPRVDSADPGYRRFICGRAVKKWMNAGVKGWRLDVVDEVADEFLDDFRAAVRSRYPDAVVIGEVWEDATDKISYGRRRRYLTGRQLDSVMNYPLRTGVIDYVLHGNAESLRRATEGLYRRYPKEASDNLLNFLGTHDTERILTVLGGEPCGNRTNEELSTMKMTEEERERAKARLRLAWGILYGLPGVPCVFYGDEAGLEGYRDPFCRRPFPWSRVERGEDADLTDFCRTVGGIRRDEPVFRGGRFRILSLTEDAFVYAREPWRDECRAVVVAAVRRGTIRIRFPAPALSLEDEAEAEEFVLGACRSGYYRLPEGTEPEKIVLLPRE